MVKYCFSNRHSEKVLLQADEIFVEYRDIEEVPALFEKYPKALVILDIPFNERPDLDQLIKWNESRHKYFCVQLNDVNLIQSCSLNSINFYLSYHARSFYEVEALKKMGVCNIIVEAPIFFDWNKVESYEIPIRVTPHRANSGVLEYENGVCGTWIRPEDLDAYDPCIVDFSDVETTKAETLYEIYKLNKRWPGDLNLLVNDLNFKCNNRLISSVESRRRLNCGQRCKGYSKCRLCYNLLKVANIEQLREYISKTSTKEVNE